MSSTDGLCQIGEAVDETSDWVILALRTKARLLRNVALTSGPLSSSLVMPLEISSVEMGLGKLTGCLPPLVTVAVVAAAAPCLMRTGLGTRDEATGLEPVIWSGGSNGWSVIGSV